MNRVIPAFILYLTLAATVAAQSLGPSTLSGNEVWNCSINGPQGPSAFCSAVAVKNYVNSTGAFSLVSGGVSPVQCPYGPSSICWQTSNSPAFAFASFDGTGNQTRTWDQLTGRMDLYSNSVTGATVGPAFVLAFNHTTPANNDILGHYAFRGLDSASNYDTYGWLLATAENVTATTLNSTLQLGVMQNVNGTGGNAQPNVSAILDGSNSLFSLPSGFQFSASGNGVPYTATNTSGPEIVLTNTTNSRVARFGVADNFNTILNSTGGGGGVTLEVAGASMLNLNSAGTIVRSAVPFQVGTTALTTSGSALGINKMTASGVAPGAAGAKIELVCGTNAGSAKLIAYAGTSTTAVTILDNIGSGVTGC
jgi:hypothetical protein